MSTPPVTAANSPLALEFGGRLAASESLQWEKDGEILPATTSPLLIPFLSVRLDLPKGDIPIIGIVLDSGQAQQQLLVRGVGPSLARLGHTWPRAEMWRSTG